MWVLQTSPIFNNFVANFIYVSHYSKKQVIKTETRKTEISEKKTAVEKKRKMKKEIRWNMLDLTIRGHYQTEVSPFYHHTSVLGLSQFTANTI